ncbi:MAG TPA: tetratricopeptide repeat protein [Chthoniobacterales bacterium]
MKFQEGILLSLFVLVSLGANEVGPTKSEMEAMYGAAAHEVNAGRYGAALKQLDAIDARQPDMASAKNLRGVALMRLGEYGLAENALHQAREIDPNLWEARFNLAEVPFLQKRWAEARDRFAALLKDKREETEGATGDLIQFKILLTWLLQGKEKRAAEILQQLQDSSVSPGYYCGKAAFAFQHKDETEARVALKAAEKSFSPSLYGLFRESFYEIGWLEKPEGEIPAALQVTSVAERVGRAQADYAKAEGAYRQGDYESALQSLDKVDQAAPNQAVSFNLRGQISLAQGKPEAAEASFRDALRADPQMAEARLNLALVPFKKGDYDAARKQLEELLDATTNGAKERQRAQLIRYEIFLTLLRESRDAAAQKAIDEFKMMDETPALYYAQAAWAFQHGNFKLGNNWIANASNLYPAELNHSFAAPIADFGWLQGGNETAPSATPAALAKSTPAPAATASASASPSLAKNRAAEAATPTATPRQLTKETPAPAKETPAPVIAQNEPPRATASPTPEASATPKKIADVSKKKKKSERQEKKEKRNTTGGKSKEKERPRRKRAEIEIRRAKAVFIPTPTPAPTPPRQNLGDKIERLILYPFQHRKGQPVSTPPPASTPASTSSASPTPSTNGSRKN